MFKFSLCVASIALACCVALAQDAKDRQSEKELDAVGYNYQLKRKLGVFGRMEPYTNAYNRYATTFLKEHNDWKNDDYRFYRPTEQHCINFFNSYNARDHELQYLYEFIVLDACLGLLYDEPQYVAQETRLFETLRKDPYYLNLYKNTKVLEMTDGQQKCLADLMINSVWAKNQFAALNDHYIQLFIQFAECTEEEEITEQMRETDSYLNLIYSLVREQGKISVAETIGDINKDVRKFYKSAKFVQVYSKATKRYSMKSRAIDGYKWPVPVFELLKMIQNPREEPNIRAIHSYLQDTIRADQLDKELKAGNKVLGNAEIAYRNKRDLFLKNIADSASKSLLTKSYLSKGNLDGDKGQQRYTSFIDNKCIHFRTSDGNNVDFAIKITRLVRLLKYEYLFGISTSALLESILADAYESAPIYLCVFACNVLTNTLGVIEGYGNELKRYVVRMNADTSKMVRWPTLGYD